MVGLLPSLPAAAGSADWAGDPVGHKSITGFVFLLHGEPLACRSRLQGLVTTSTADAEFVAASEASKECTCLRRVVGLMGEDDAPVTLRENIQDRTKSDV